MTRPIDWEAVERNLVCPQCGDKASIDPGSIEADNSAVGYHTYTHRFLITSDQARELSRPKGAARQARIAELRAELEELEKDA